MIYQFPMEKDRLIHNGSILCPANAKSSFQLYPVRYNLFCEDLLTISTCPVRMVIASYACLQSWSYSSVICFPAVFPTRLESSQRPQVISYLSSYSLFYLKSLASCCNSRQDCLNKGQKTTSYRHNLNKCPKMFSVKYSP